MKKTAEQISYNMSKIKCKDSDIEILLRKELWDRGLHYRKNVKTVFGKPDIAFIGKRVAVFCDGEFWHGYNWEQRKEDFKSNKDFWVKKIERNMIRDTEVNEKLTKDNWIVLRFWTNEIKKDTKKCADVVEKALQNR